MSSERPAAVGGARFFARRSEPLTARTFLEDGHEWERGSSGRRERIPPHVPEVAGGDFALFSAVGQDDRSGGDSFTLARRVEQRP